MTPPTKPCPSCSFQCPPKALRCRGCDRWFLVDPPRRSLTKWRILGAVVLALILRSCYLVATEPPKPPPFDVPALEGETWFEHEARRQAEGLRTGVFHTEVCPMCKGRGYLVSPQSLESSSCWACKGRGYLVVGP